MWYRSVGLRKRIGKLTFLREYHFQNLAAFQTNPHYSDIICQYALNLTNKPKCSLKNNVYYTEHITFSALINKLKLIDFFISFFWIAENMDRYLFIKLEVNSKKKNKGMAINAPRALLSISSTCS